MGAAGPHVGRSRRRFSILVGLPGLPGRKTHQRPHIPAPWFVAGTGDFNGDGKSDILWRDDSGNTSMWFMNGTMVAAAAFVGNIPTTWTVRRSTPSEP
jgi:FG-GAP repeat